MNHTPPNLLRTLRQLIPERPLGYGEAERLAELQANVLRERLGLTEPKLPADAIAGLPRISVERRRGLPVSGLTHWHNGRWLIVLNADEPEQRQLFSLAHELKHAIDHTKKHWLYWDESWRNGSTKAERLADYFAGCLLMPKRHVKSLFGTRPDPVALAVTFGVSQRAMTVRLCQLGLIGPTPRCLRTGPRWDHLGSPYFRNGAESPGVAA